jgi:hypothetical protein
LHHNFWASVKIILLVGLIFCGILLFPITDAGRLTNPLAPSLFFDQGIDLIFSSNLRQEIFSHGNAFKSLALKIAQITIYHQQRQTFSSYSLLIDLLPLILFFSYFYRRNRINTGDDPYSFYWCTPAKNYMSLEDMNV